MYTEVEYFLIFYLLFLLSEFSLSFLCWLTVGVFMLSLSVSHTCWIIFLSLLLIIASLVWPCKNFNWHLIAYKSDFQNVNNNYHRGRSPSGQAPLCPSVPLGMTCHPWEQKPVSLQSKGVRLSPLLIYILYLLYSLVNQKSFGIWNEIVI